MLFKKTGNEVREAVSSALDGEKQAYQSACERFDKQKSKTDLHLMNEIESRIERFERILRHIKDKEDYELTEQDLIDFGF